jgi:hypothetical protein
MFVTFLMVIVLPASIILNVILLRRGLNIVKQNDELNEALDILQNQREDTLQTLESLLENMREYDLKGAFESDDEVGGAYKEIISLIENYKNEL